jgi:cell wall-associated NlpC family hydrolase
VLKNKITVLIISVIFFLACKPAIAAELQDGDIIFQNSRSPQSQLLKQVTRSRYNHMGIILYRHGFPQVLEAADKVKFTPLNEWIDRGVDGKIVVKRLRKADTLLNSDTLGKMRRLAEELLDRPYDSWFGWSDNRFYCSELVWKIYKKALNIELGKMQKLKEFNLSSPEVKEILSEYYGNKIPVEEKAISPAAIFASKALVAIEQ